MSDSNADLNAESPQSSDPAEGNFWGTVLDQAAATEPAEGNEGEPDSLAASAVVEIEKLMSDLVSARDYLVAEAERIKRENARLKNLSRTALASVHIISDNLSKWRENGKQAA
jgi:hypothetical protein